MAPRHWPHERRADGPWHKSLCRYGTALVCTLILAIFLSWLIQATGPQTHIRGVKIALIAWFGFVFTTWATEYAFEARSLQILAINTGYSLTGMVLMGAILGAWKKKA